MPERKGLFFKGYDYRRMNSGGYFCESWVTSEQLDSYRQKARLKIAELRRAAKIFGIAQREINPQTKRVWERGNFCEERGFFWAYGSLPREDGSLQLRFKKTFEEYHGAKVKENLRIVAYHAERKNIQFDIDQNYAISIFPKDWVCPIFKVEMKWSNKSRDPHSPSLDRIEPELGYVVDNVVWISNRANTIKNNGSLEEFRKIRQWLSKQ